MATEAITQTIPVVAITYKPLSPFQLAVRRFRRNRMAIAGLVIVLIFVFAGVAAPVISPYPYDKTSAFVFRAPGTLPGHLLGTDEVGRDFMSRLISGATTSLEVSLSATIFCFIIGAVLGFLSAWYGGVIDYLMSRVIEVVGSMPGLLFQILIMSLLGNGIVNVTFTITILAWPSWVRLVRAQVLSFKTRDFIEASRALGASTSYIAWRHIMTNVLNPLLILISFSIPTFITSEAGLSFLGYGINEPVPSWGKMLASAGQYVQSYIYMAIIPALIIIVLFVGFSFFGDGVRDALDPQSDRAKI